MKNYALTLDIQLFAEAVDTGVEDVPAAEEQTEQQESNETPETGVEEQAAAEPKENNFEKAFAKRLAAEREKWESERQAELEKYKDYDIAKKSLEYMMKTNNISDPLTLKEQIELQELQERADQQNVPPEVLKRIDELEQKAAKAEEYEKLQQEQQKIAEFEEKIKEFSKENNVDHMELWKFMHENDIGKPEVALKAMQYDEMKQQLENAEKEGVRKFLEAKGSMPTVEGKTQGGTPSTEPPKNFSDALSRAKQRLANWGNMEG